MSNVRPNHSKDVRVLDELVPAIEEIRSTGAVVLLKWDGERAKNKCTVVVTRQDSDYVFREDSDDIAGSLARAIADYRSQHEH
jgi:hypothetical protein